MGQDLVAVSPSELLPPPLPLTSAAWRKGSIVGILLILVVSGALLVPRFYEKTTAELLAEANTALENGKYDVAATHLERVLRRQPRDAEAHYLLGIARMATGQLASAEAELRVALESGLNKDMVIPALGRALLLQGKFENLLEEIKAPVERKSTLDVEVRSLRGNALLGIGKTAEAKAVFEQELQLHPDSPDALLGAARVAAIEERLLKADALVDRALRVDARNLDGLTLKAELYFARNRIEDAKATLREILRIYPRDAHAQLRSAWSAIRADQIDAAASHVEAARQIVPDLLATNYLHALVEFKRQQYSNARQAVQRALKAAPTDAPSLILAGGIAYAEQRYADAEALLRRSLEREPANVGGRKLYAASLLKQSRPSSALEVLLATLRIAPSDADLLTLLGHGYLQSGDHARAARYLDQAAQLPPSTAKANEPLGRSPFAAVQFGPPITAPEAGLRSDAGSSELDSLMAAVNLKLGSTAEQRRTGTH